MIHTCGQHTGSPDIYGTSFSNLLQKVQAVVLIMHCYYVGRVATVRGTGAALLEVEEALAVAAVLEVLTRWAFILTILLSFSTCMLLHVLSSTQTVG